MKSFLFALVLGTLILVGCAGPQYNRHEVVQIGDQPVCESNTTISGSGPRNPGSPCASPMIARGLGMGLAVPTNFTGSLQEYTLSSNLNRGDVVCQPQEILLDDGSTIPGPPQCRPANSRTMTVKR